MQDIAERETRLFILMGFGLTALLVFNFIHRTKSSSDLTGYQHSQLWLRHFLFVIHLNGNQFYFKYSSYHNEFQFSIAYFM